MLRRGCCTILRKMSIDKYWHWIVFINSNYWFLNYNFLKCQGSILGLHTCKKYCSPEIYYWPNHCFISGTHRGVKGLPLNLFSVITPGRYWETIWAARNQALDSAKQVPWLLYYLSSPHQFLLFRVEAEIGSFWKSLTVQQLGSRLS